jgi:stearoyl-CoA desaturase (delta-9 desaturase)
MFALGGTWALMTLYIVPAVVLWNAGSLINTVCHTPFLGYRRYKVPDNSTNNPVLGLLMWGEGWHNNHHRFQSRANIGERWYEIDIGYYIIKLIKKA